MCSRYPRPDPRALLFPWFTCNDNTAWARAQRQGSPYQLLVVVWAGVKTLRLSPARSFGCDRTELYIAGSRLFSKLAHKKLHQRDWSQADTEGNEGNLVRASQVFIFFSWWQHPYKQVRPYCMVWMDGPVHRQGKYGQLFAASKYGQRLTSTLALLAGVRVISVSKISFSLYKSSTLSLSYFKK